MTSLAVIIPTLGHRRALLDSALRSCADADQVIVSEDHFAKGCYGHPVRNSVLNSGHIGTTHVVSIDDDDVFLPGAIRAMKDAVADDPDGLRWFVFRMIGGDASHFPGVVVGARAVVAKGDVGTPMMVFPATVKSRFGVSAIVDHFGHPHAPGYFGDWEMAVRLRRELGEPTFVNVVTAEIRPAIGTTA